MGTVVRCTNWFIHREGVRYGTVGTLVRYIVHVGTVQ